jgi:predicted NBD/HSP70 family sugar kinase
MQVVGLDYYDGKATLVVVDGEGTVLVRHNTGAFDDLVTFTLVDGAPDGFGIAVDLSSRQAVAAIAAERNADRSDPGAGGPNAHLCEPGAAAVTAEAWVGAARDARHAVCLVIGDRVLAGILLDGKPWSGAHDMAGAAAWLALNPVERQDYRKFGSLAAEVSNKGIARRLSWRIQAGDHSAVLEKAGDLEAITAEHVFEGARTGDGVSISVVRDTAKYIGMAVANLAATVDPEIVVLAGSIAAAGDLLLEPVRQECARRLPPGMADKVRIEISPLGADGVAIGAARLAMLART